MSLSKINLIKKKKQSKEKRQCLICERPALYCTAVNELNLAVEMNNYVSLRSFFCSFLFSKALPTSRNRLLRRNFPPQTDFHSAGSFWCNSGSRQCVISNEQQTSSKRETQIRCSKTLHYLENFATDWVQTGQTLLGRTSFPASLINKLSKNPRSEKIGQKLQPRKRLLR